MAVVTLCLSSDPDLPSLPENQAVAGRAITNEQLGVSLLGFRTQSLPTAETLSNPQWFVNSTLQDFSRDVRCVDLALRIAAVRQRLSPRIRDDAAAHEVADD